MFINRKRKPNKRGFTLVELTIVMAITAIISVMIVSFSVLISAQVRKNNLRADFLESVITLRTDLQKQFAEVDGREITISEDKKTLTIDNPNFSFDWGKYKYIDETTFSKSGKILKVTVTNDTLHETQSFILISKVE